MPLIEELPMPVIDGHGFGRHLHWDERSRAYAVPARATGKTTVWAHGPILSQGALGSCTGHAMVAALMSGNLRRPALNLNHDDALRCYSRATQIDPFPGEYPPTDTGSDGLDVCKAAQEFGWITSYDHAFGFDALCAAIEQQPGLLGFPVFENFMNTGPDGMVPEPAGNVIAGHEVCIDGVDYERQLFIFPNSWTEQWGDGGVGYFTFATMRFFTAGGGADVSVPRISSAPTPSQATLSVAPTHGASTSTFTVFGSGFHDKVGISIGGAGPFDATADGSGHFEKQGMSVSNRPPGPVTVAASDGTTGYAEATYTVDSAPSPPSPTPGDRMLTEADRQDIENIVAKAVQSEIVRALRNDGVSGAADPRRPASDDEVRKILEHGDANWHK